MLIVVFLILLIPLIVLIALGRENLQKEEKNTALVYFILVGAYLLVGIGVCGNMF